MCEIAETSEASGSMSETSSDEGETGSGKYAESRKAVSLEQLFIREVQDIIDSSHAREAEHMLVRGG